MDAVRAVADELHEAILDRFPLSATLLGAPGRNHLLPEHTVRADAEFAVVLREIAAEAAAIDAGALSRTDRITRTIVLERAAALLAAIEADWVEFTVSDLILTPVPGLLLTLSTIPVSTERECEDHLHRLRGLPRFLDTLADRHLAGITAGRLPVAHLVDAAVAHLDAQLADLGAVRPGPPFGDRCDPVLAEVVAPALTRYRDRLAAEVRPHGRDADHAGLCWLPDGDRLYATAVREHTTVDYDPGELHRIGSAVLDRLAGEYAEIGARVFGAGELPEIFARLRDDPSLRYRDADEMLADAESAVRRAEAAAPPWFRTLPRQSCVVAAYPATTPAATPPAYLVRALDGSRPGTYFVNPAKPADTARYLAEVTAFHEAVPGHHLEGGTRQERTGLPLLRRTAGLSVYCEGWALYAERLADEMGLYSGDLARLGMLVMDSVRAGRLVVDTGLHALGWSRRQAVEFLAAATPMTPALIESEVDRYLAQPAQALAYLVGRLEIQRLREEAERALGAAFDLPGFHEVVLGEGRVPLGVLAESVAEWIAARTPLSGGPESV